MSRILRPAQPVAVGVMLGQVCTGILVLALVVLLGDFLRAFDWVLLAVSGVALVGLGVVDAERDGLFLPAERWPSLRTRAVVWGLVILFASGPMIFAALILDRFIGSSVVEAVAVGVSSAGWALNCFVKLWVDPLWLPRPKDEEVEAGLAVGALLLSAVLVTGWLIVRIDDVFGRGPLPTSLSSADGRVLSLVASASAGVLTLTSLLLARMLRGRSVTSRRAAFAMFLGPLAVLLLLPSYRWGQPLPAFVPVYASSMAGRVFLSCTFAFGVVEFFRSRRAD